MMGTTRSRRVPMTSPQLALDLGEGPVAPLHIWDALPAAEQRAVVAAWARLIAQAAVREEHHDVGTDVQPVA
jgi:hypothetical protein